MGLLELRTLLGRRRRCWWLAVVRVRALGRRDWRLELLLWTWGIKITRRKRKRKG
jgi:hypothetical protein